MISVIVATDINNVIGGDDEQGNPTIPWYCPEDLRTFKHITTNGTVIMGRRTYDSLPTKFRPLPNRKNIVISRSMVPVDDVDVVESFEQVIDRYLSNSRKDNVFIIGGQSIYEQSMEYADVIYQSLIYDDYGKPLELDQSKLSNVKKFPEIDMSQFYKQLTTFGGTMELTIYQRKCHA